jgi:hypothetical protein
MLTVDNKIRKTRRPYVTGRVGHEEDFSRIFSIFTFVIAKRQLSK